jgi:hypothetical protein
MMIRLCWNDLYQARTDYSPQGLLYSCTFTLGVCVWTSIHLNVASKESSWSSWRRKVKWLFIALFAPEVVVFTAFQQWLTAKLFLKELVKISDATASKDLEVSVFFPLH